MPDTIREFSRKIDIFLEADGTTIPVNQLCGEFIVTSHPWAVSPCVGAITLKIDDVVDRFTVYLVDGIDPARPEQPILMHHD